MDTKIINQRKVNQGQNQPKILNQFFVNQKDLVEVIEQV